MEHKHEAGKPLDYNYVSDGIFIGTNQCCAGGLSEVLKEEGISADISLEDVRIDHPFGVDMYLWLPTVDGQSPSNDQLTLGVQTLAEIIRKKEKCTFTAKTGMDAQPPSSPPTSSVLAQHRKKRSLPSK